MCGHMTLKANVPNRIVTEISGLIDLALPVAQIFELRV